MQEMGEFGSVRVINKRIDSGRMSSAYYARKRREIRKEVSNAQGDVIINLIPNEEIRDKCILELFLHLQREFTDIVVIPPTSLKGSEFAEWMGFFNPTHVLMGV